MVARICPGPYRVALCDTLPSGESVTQRRSSGCEPLLQELDGPFQITLKAGTSFNLPATGAGRLTKAAATMAPNPTRTTLPAAPSLGMFTDYRGLLLCVREMIRDKYNAACTCTCMPAPPPSAVAHWCDAAAAPRAAFIAAFAAAFSAGAAFSAAQ